MSNYRPITPAQCCVVLNDPDEGLMLCPEPVAWFFHVPPGITGYCKGHKRDADAFHSRVGEYTRAWWVQVA